MILYKFQCGGNDILITEQNLTEKQVIRVLDRKEGIGSDQCLILTNVDQEKAHIDLKIYNQDGSLAARCLNGMLCLSKYLYKSSSQFWTIGSDCVVDVVNNKVSLSYMPIIKQQQNFDKKPWFLCDIGNLHALILFDKNPYSLSSQDFFNICFRFNQENFFENGINISLIFLDESNNCHVRTFERGSGETLACASAVLSSFFVMKQSKVFKFFCKIASYEIQEKDNQFWLKGMPLFVFKAVDYCLKN